MKTKIQLAEERYKACLDVHIIKKNIENLSSFLSEDFYGICDFIDKPLCGKDQYLFFLKQMHSHDFHALEIDFSFLHSEELGPDTVAVYSSFSLRGLFPCGMASVLRLNQTALLREESGCFKVCHFHTSAAGEISDEIRWLLLPDAPALADNLPCGIVMFSLRDFVSLLYGNKTFYRLCGYREQDAKAKFEDGLHALPSPDYLVAASKAIRQAREKGERDITFENKLLRPDNTAIWVLVCGTLSADYQILTCVIVDISGRKSREEDLMVKEKRLRIAMEKTSDFVFDYDILTRQMVQPVGVAQLYNLPCQMENVPLSLVEDGIITEESTQDFLTMYERIARGEATVSSEIKTKDKNGSFRWNKFTLSTIYDDAQNPIRAIGLIEDITKEKELEMAFFQEEQYRQAMLSNVVLYLEMNLTKDAFYRRKGNWNFEFEGEIEYRYSQILNAVLLHSIVEEYRQAYYDTFHLENALKSFASGIYDLKAEYRRVMDDGRIAWMQTTMTMVKDIATNDIKGFMYVRDIEERKKAELKLEYASCHDSLTGLYNRAYTTVLIQEALREAPAKEHAFFILDIDHFKDINDKYGHFVGDQVLTSAARSLTDLFNPTDIIGRIGGDEFVVFIKDIGGHEETDRLAQSICSCFSSPPGEDASLPSIACSIGISLFRADGDTFEPLYRNADYALYEAKRLGRNRYVYYKQNMTLEGFVSRSGSRIDTDTIR